MQNRETDVAFLTEEQCQKYLFDVRKKLGLVCTSKCDNPTFWLTNEGKYICSSCKAKSSIRKDTIFQDSRLSLMAWFKGLRYISSASQTGRISTKGLQAELGAGSKHTAINIMRKIKRVMYTEAPEKLTGEVAVILDPGKQVVKNKSLVVGVEMVNGKPGCIKCCVVKKNSPEEQIEFINKNTEAGTKILYDGFLKGSNQLEKKGYIFNCFVPFSALKVARWACEDLGKRLFYCNCNEDVVRIIENYCAEVNALKRPVFFETLVEKAVIFSYNKK